jgi:putative spermidine/putrescine transport system ATP-binding protein
LSTLSLKNVSKRFKDSFAVQDVTLDIHSGEFFSILGPSGCGKTTLLRMIAGFELPTTGSVFLNDRDITSALPQHRGIGMVFQNYALFPHMTVLQNVAFGLETKKVPKGEIRSRVEKILDSVHLEHKIDTPVPQLSGGEQQRVAVARALVVEPSVLLFDEPLSNLDVALRLSTREEIRALQRRTGITTIYVTHDQSEAMSLSDRIAVMEGGRVVQVGTPAETYEHPSTVFVAGFLGGANIVHGIYDAATRLFTSGLLRVHVPKGKWNESGNVVLGIKPEAITFGNSSVKDDGLIHARIAEKEYLGFTTTFLVDASGIMLRIASLSSDSIRIRAIEEIVSLKLDWSKITILPDFE